MSRKWFGSLNNRLEEGKQFVDEIRVGDGVTEYFYSDRRPYEVIAVNDQKHITIRGLDHKHIGDCPMDNNWELYSNEENATYDLMKRGNNWYIKQEATLDDWNKAKADQEKGDLNLILWFCNNGFNGKKLEEDGKTQRRYQKMNISIGKAEYYYDYSF